VPPGPPSLARSRTWHRLFTAVTLALTLVAAEAFSQPAPAPSEPSVAELKQRANEAMIALHPAEALAGYRKAYELSSEPALLYNMGHALEALEDFPAALVEYEEFGRKATPDLKARVRLDELLAETQLKVTLLTIQCPVAGARVLFRDKTLGTVPPSGHLDVRVNSGPAHVEVDADGYGPFVRDVQLPGGGVLSVTAELVPTEKAGVLTVATDPGGGKVRLDGKDLGVAPVEASVTAGMHTVSVSRSGFRSVESSVVVAARDRKSVTLKLEPVPSILTRWWFWTGVAAVVAGGVVASYAALTERAPDRGTIDPGLQHVP